MPEVFSTSHAVPSNTKHHQKESITVGNYTNDTSDITPVSNSSNISIPTFSSQWNLIQFIFPTTVSIYNFDGSDSIVSYNNNVYSMEYSQETSQGHLFFFTNGFLSSNPLVQSTVASINQIIPQSMPLSKPKTKNIYNTLKKTFFVRS